MSEAGDATLECEQGLVSAVRVVFLRAVLSVEELGSDHDSIVHVCFWSVVIRQFRHAPRPAASRALLFTRTLQTHVRT